MSPEYKAGFNRPHTEWELRIIRKTEEEYRAYSQLLRQEFNAQFIEDFGGMAFNVGLTREEMTAHLQEDPRKFKKVYGMAITQVLEYQEAERIYEQRLVKGEILLDRVGRAYNKKRRKSFPKPERLYQQDKPRRKRRTKTQLAARAEGFLKWRRAFDALNTEKATPLDEYPDTFPPGE